MKINNKIYLFLEFINQHLHSVGGLSSPLVSFCPLSA